MNTETNKATGVLFIRCLLGIILFMQGYGKIFKFGTDNLFGSFMEYESYFPVSVLKLVMYYTTYGELIFGALLVLGLFRFWTYSGIALILLLVSFGHGLHQVIWDMGHVMYRAVLLIPLFLLPVSLDKYSIDALIKSRKKA